LRATQANPTNMEKTIFIIRHGETDLNRQGIVQGSGVDAPLNQRGWEQAHAFYRHYKKENFEVALTSRLLRTHQTMEPFIKSGLPWEQFEEINEISWGVHEGKDATPEMKEEHQELINQWNMGNFHARIAGGESAVELAERLGRFVDHLRERPEKKILICSHGRAMRCLTCVLKEEPLHNMENYHHANTGLFLFGYRDMKFYMEIENDTRHLGVVGGSSSSGR
jgi:phosphoserine phosphatase